MNPQPIRKEQNMGRELERKYRADAAALAAIAAHYGDFTTITMQTTYYDTFDGKLLSRRWTLRQRLENGKSICTLKTPLEDGARGEWEVEAPGLITGIPLLCRDGAPMELMALTVNGIVPVCGARFTRQAKTVVLEEGTVEIALDQGVLTGRGREQPFCEVEVEVKSGSEAAALRFADTLARTYGLQPEENSKYRRALILAYT